MKVSLHPSSLNPAIHFKINQFFSYRRAVLQKWREKHGPRATYRNLAKSFCEAGNQSLVETVCKVVTRIHATGTSQIPYLPPQRLWLFANSQACRYCVPCVIVVVASVLLAFYTSEKGIPLDQVCFSFPLTIANHHKAGEDAPHITYQACQLYLWIGMTM